MSGPIVRSGPSPEFSKNWEQVFGKKQVTKPAKATKSSAKTTAPAKGAKAKSPAKPAKAAAKKAKPAAPAKAKAKKK